RSSPKPRPSHGNLRAGCLLRFFYAMSRSELHRSTLVGETVHSSLESSSTWHPGTCNLIDRLSRMCSEELQRVVRKDRLSKTVNRDDLVSRICRACRARSLE